MKRYFLALAGTESADVCFDEVALGVFQAGRQAIAQDDVARRLVAGILDFDLKNHIFTHPNAFGTGHAQGQGRGGRL